MPQRTLVSQGGDSTEIIPNALLESIGRSAREDFKERWFVPVRVAEFVLETSSYSGR